MVVSAEPLIEEVVHGPVTDKIRTRMEALWGDGKLTRQTRIEARRTPPLIRLWDGDWNYIATVNDDIEASFQWKLNDTGAGYLRLPADSWLAKWVMNFRNRTSKNVHMTADKDGARWGGRLNNAAAVKTETGERYVELNFLHDYEEVKHIYVWPNPFLPAAVQFPRAFTLAGPTAWVLKMALFLNVRRLAGHTWALPDDPFDINQWAGQYRPETWPIQIAPSKALLSDSSPWTVISSRMKNWHDLAAPKLSTSHLMVTTRRWLTGDPLPWKGARVTHGTLIVDIVDKSGYWSTEGTATFGDIWEGMVRTVQTVIDPSTTKHSILKDPIDEPAYEATNWLSTVPNAPYVVYRDRDLAGVEASNFTWHPATDVQVITGGHSMPGVNEALSTAVMLVGNYMANIFSFALQLGHIADKFLAPIYEDTILAWFTIKSITRAQELGWSHYYEHFADGADKAYTLSSIVAMREGFWETRERVSHQLTIADGAPWFVGDNGEGHFFLGDRIGATIDGLEPGQIVVEQVTSLTYNHSRSKRGWDITCGDPTSQQSPLETILARVKDATGAIHDLGLI